MPEENKMQKQVKLEFASAAELPVYYINTVNVRFGLKERHARVLRSFNIEVQTVKGGFVAVSDVSDVFELGETPTQAVLSYLYSVVDELIWLQEHTKSLSLPMLKDLDKLQLYLRLV
jgi:hypothetical protein